MSLSELWATECRQAEQPADPLPEIRDHFCQLGSFYTDAIRGGIPKDKPKAITNFALERFKPFCAWFKGKGYLDHLGTWAPLDIPGQALAGVIAAGCAGEWAKVREIILDAAKYRPEDMTLLGRMQTRKLDLAEHVIKCMAPIPAEPDASDAKLQRETSPPSVAQNGEPANKLTFVPGGFIYCRVEKDLSGKPLEVLQMFAGAHGGRVSCSEFQDTIWRGTESGMETVKCAVSDARKELRAAIRQATGKRIDPLPCVDFGKNLAWKLSLPK